MVRRTVVVGGIDGIAVLILRGITADPPLSMGLCAAVLMEAVVIDRTEVTGAQVLFGRDRDRIRALLTVDSINHQVVLPGRDTPGCRLTAAVGVVVDAQTALTGLTGLDVGIVGSEREGVVERGFNRDRQLGVERRIQQLTKSSRRRTREGCR